MDQTVVEFQLKYQWYNHTSVLGQDVCILIFKDVLEFIILNWNICWFSRFSRDRCCIDSKRGAFFSSSHKSSCSKKQSLMNGGFLVVKGLLVRSVKDGIIGNSIFCDLRSICGLYFSSQESPRITRAEGVLIMLYTMDLLWLPNFTSKGVVLGLMSPEEKGRLSITTTCIGLSFLTIWILWKTNTGSKSKCFESLRTKTKWDGKAMRRLSKEIRTLIDLKWRVQP